MICLPSLFRTISLHTVSPHNPCAPLHFTPSPPAPLCHEDEIVKERKDLRWRLEQAADDGGAEGPPVPPQVVHQAVQCGAVQSRAHLVEEEGAASAQEHLCDGHALALTAADASAGEGEGLGLS